MSDSLRPWFISLVASNARGQPAPQTAVLAVALLIWRQFHQRRLKGEPLIAASAAEA